MAMAKDRAQQDGTEALLKALGHPMRRKTMRMIVGRGTEPVSPSEIAGELQQPLSNVCYHVRVLVDCGALTLMKTKPSRGSMQHFYRPSTMFEGLPWVATVLDASGDAA
jgi:DNA-binding transcriptional ArsR family regulator